MYNRSSTILFAHEQTHTHTMGRGKNKKKWCVGLGFIFALKSHQSGIELTTGAHKTAHLGTNIAVM